LKEASSQKRLIRIKYINQAGKTTYRTLSNSVFLPFSIKDEQSFYIQGYCFLAKEIRTFRGDRIRKVEVLDLKYQ